MARLSIGTVATWSAPPLVRFWRAGYPVSIISQDLYVVVGLKVKDRGECAQNALPVLAVYMGHSDYKHTSVYLRVADAAARQHLLDFALWQKRKT